MQTTQGIGVVLCDRAVTAGDRHSIQLTWFGRSHGAVGVGRTRFQKPRRPANVYESETLVQYIRTRSVLRTAESRVAVDEEQITITVNLHTLIRRYLISRQLHQV